MEHWSKAQPADAGDAKHQRSFAQLDKSKRTTDQPTNPTNKHATLWVFHEDGTATSAARVALNQADTLKPQRNRPYDDRKRTDAGKHTHVERQLVVGRNMRVGKLAQVEVSAAQQRVNVLTQRGYSEYRHSGGGSHSEFCRSTSGMQAKTFGRRHAKPVFRCGFFAAALATCQPAGRSANR